jgi:glycosyltransferase involved in cell wall biosynthesis
MLRKTECGAPPASQGPFYVEIGAGDARRGLPVARRPIHIAILMKNFQYGGTQRVLLRIANKLNDYGHRVQILSGGPGALRSTLSDGVEEIALRRTSQLMGRLRALAASGRDARAVLMPIVLPIFPIKGLQLLRPLIDYLGSARPDVLISATSSLNVVAVLAKRYTGVDTGLVLTEHVSWDQRRVTDRRWARRFMPHLMRDLYPDAHVVVGVSSGIVTDLRTRVCLPEDKVRCIYNPAVPDNIADMMGAMVDHPWFAAEQPPVILSAGRAGRTKDYSTMLHAFARIRAQRRARLVLLSSAEKGSLQARQLDALGALARSLGVADDFAILDFTPNPFRFMARAGAFVSSSMTEGFGNVVAEALACGCPVVSTRTEGPTELLQDGRYGRLVPVGDEVAMAKALIDVLQMPRNSMELARRADAFTEERVGRAYEELCRSVSLAVASQSVRPHAARTQ